MQIDRDAFACYVSLTPSGLTIGVAKTVELSDLVLVDVDDAGEPVGLEFVMPAVGVRIAAANL